LIESVRSRYIQSDGTVIALVAKSLIDTILLWTC
jgi:hypothetical protein